MRQVVNGGKGGPLLGQSSCMAVQSLDDEELEEEMTKTIGSGGPRQQVERERRLRREIANSNERRRMQSINHGYNMLKNMLPVTDGSEKLSKAAVLQQAADYMSQLIEDRKQLLSQNSELTKALSCKRPHSDSLTSDSTLSLKRQKRNTESSDEGISLSYQPAISSYLTTSGSISVDSDHQHLIEELRRDVTELRVQLEREKQRRSLLEQSYSYYNSFVQAAQQSVAAISNGHIATTPPSLQPSLITPPNSRHSSTEELQDVISSESSMQDDGYRQSADSNHCTVSESERIPNMYGKASSVASQNLSIIVEAINHLESDKERLSATSNERDVDSGVSHGECSSDDTKSDCSRTETPQPPPAHQATSTLPYHHHSHHHTSLYNAPVPPPVGSSGHHTTPAAAGIPLIYRPTFLSRSGLVAASQASPVGVIVSHHSPS